MVEIVRLFASNDMIAPKQARLLLFAHAKTTIFRETGAEIVTAYHFRYFFFAYLILKVAFMHLACSTPSTFVIT